MTDFRNYIYRLAESVSGDVIPEWDRVRHPATMVKFANPRRPTKTPAGWRYDADSQLKQMAPSVHEMEWDNPSIDRTKSGWGDV